MLEGRSWQFQVILLTTCVLLNSSYVAGFTASASLGRPGDGVAVAHCLHPVLSTFPKPSTKTANNAFETRFMVHMSTARSSNTCLFATKSKDEKGNVATKSTDTSEETISDVDARVLKSMLQNSKLDLKTEEGVRKLLERGTVKKVPSARSKTKVEDDDSEFSSTVLKKLSDTKLWRSLQAKSAGFLESVGIWVANRVEQDVKVLAALGLFAWDRAVRDVGRALPESRQQIKKTIFLLSNSSSFDDEAFQKQQAEWRRQKELQQQLYRPSDEIKSVSREILGILSGQRNAIGGSSGRGLRTAAPAGLANAAERQRRAFIQRQKINQQKKDVTKIAGTVVDSAVELKRELQAERSTPGYKTEPIRKAIAAAAVGTGNLLREAATEARLAASKRKEMRALKAAGVSATGVNASGMTFYAATNVTLKKMELDSVATAGLPSQATTNNPKDVLQVMINQMQDEVEKVSDRLNRCIQEPGDIWLRNYGKDTSSTRRNLREVVTQMILVRNLVDAETVKPFTLTNVNNRLADLNAMRKSLDDLCSLTTTVVAANAGFYLRNFLFYGDSEHDISDMLEASLILQLEQLAAAVGTDVRASNDIKSAGENLGYVEESDSVEEVMPKISSGSFFAQAQKVKINPSNAYLSTISTSQVKDTANVENEFIVEDNNRLGFDADKQTESLHSTKAVDSNTEVVITPELIDIIPDRVIQSTWTSIQTKDSIMDVVASTIGTSTADASNQNSEPATMLGDQTDGVGVGLVAEIVTDDDFDNVFGKTKQAQVVSEYELEKEENKNDEKNLLADVTLRSLDIIFFILEKLLTVGVPVTVTVLNNMALRLESAKNEGRGTKGWRNYDKLSKNARGRY